MEADKTSLKKVIPVSFQQEFEIGESIGNGDCFFDCLAQGLKQIYGNEEITVPLLRTKCREFAEDVKSSNGDHWLSKAIRNDDEENVLKNYNYDVLKQYIDMITLCGSDAIPLMEQPVWGRPDIEGRILCEQFRVKLHVIEKSNLVDEGWLHQIVTSSGSKSVDSTSVDYDDHRILHILNSGDLHFVPILPKYIHQTGEFVPDINEESYASSGFKDSGHGILYQAKIFSVLIFKLSKSDISWIKSELEIAGHFDDLVFQYMHENKSHICYIQVKHRKNLEISQKDLLENDPFNLYKYFVSYCNITQYCDEFQNVEKDFIILTNVNFDSKMSALVKPVTEPHPILSSLSYLCAPQVNTFCKFDTDCQPFCTIIEEKLKMTIKKDFENLVSLMAKCIIENREITCRNSLVLQYHHILVKNVIDVQNVAFHREFAFGKSLDVGTEIFRKTLIESLKKSGCFINLDSIHLSLSGDFSKNTANHGFKIWPNEILMTSFLNDISFAINQPDEMSLDEIIKSEIGETFLIQENELITSATQSKVFHWMEKLQEYLRPDDILAYFSKIRLLLSKFITLGLSSQYSQFLKSFGITFKLSVDNLNNFLNSEYDQLLIIETDHTILSSIKIDQSLHDSKTTPSFFQDYIFIKLSSLLRLDLLETIPYQDKHLLVITCDEELSNPFLVFISQLLFEHNVKHLILICHRFNSENLLSGVRFVKIQENLNFCDLSVSAQKSLLSKSILLQNKNQVQLDLVLDRTSYHLFDTMLLINLMQNQSFKVGKSLPDLGDIAKFYIDRTFTYSKVVGPEIFYDLNNKNDVIAVSGISREGLTVVCRAITICDYDNLEMYRPKLPNCIIIGDDKSAFEHICREFPKDTIHWLKYENGQFLWIRTQGPMCNLLPHFIHDDNSYLLQSSIVAQDVSENNVKLISGAPGMGKSTLLKHLAFIYKQFHPSEWVIFVNLSDNSEYFSSLNNDTFSFNDALQFLAFAENLETVQEKCLLRMFINAGKCTVILDGFDEISPYYEGIVLSLIKALVEKTIIWLSTREHLKDKLENAFSVLAYTLQPLEINEQCNYLKTFWTESLQLLPAGRNKAQSFAKAITQRFADSKVSQISSLSVPLHLFMAAAVYRKMLIKLLYSDAKYFNSVELLAVPELYAEFMFTKYDNFVIEKQYGLKLLSPAAKEREQAKEYFEEDHPTYMTLSMKLLFYEEMSLIGTDDLNESCIRASRVGIIQCFSSDDNRCNFVHRSFADYFAADWIYRSLRQKRNISEYEFARRIALCYVYAISNSNFFIIKDFLDYWACKDLPLHLAIIRSDHNMPLTKEFEIVSQDLKMLDRLGRTGLHLEAIYRHQGESELISKYPESLHVRDKLKILPASYAVIGCKFSIDADREGMKFPYVESLMSLMRLEAHCDIVSSISVAYKSKHELTSIFRFLYLYLPKSGINQILQTVTNGLVEHYQNDYCKLKQKKYVWYLLYQDYFCIKWILDLVLNHNKDSLLDVFNSVDFTYILRHAALTFDFEFIAYLAKLENINASEVFGVSHLMQLNSKIGQNIQLDESIIEAISSILINVEITEDNKFTTDLFSANHKKIMDSISLVIKDNEVITDVHLRLFQNLLHWCSNNLAQTFLQPDASQKLLKAAIINNCLELAQFILSHSPGMIDKCWLSNNMDSSLLNIAMQNNKWDTICFVLEHIHVKECRFVLLASELFYQKFRESLKNLDCNFIKVVLQNLTEAEQFHLWEIFDFTQPFRQFLSLNNEIYLRSYLLQILLSLGNKDVIIGTLYNDSSLYKKVLFLACEIDDIMLLEALLALDHHGEKFNIPKHSIHQFSANMKMTVCNCMVLEHVINNLHPDSRNTILNSPQILNLLILALVERSPRLAKFLFNNINENNIKIWLTSEGFKKSIKGVFQSKDIKYFHFLLGNLPNVYHDIIWSHLDVSVAFHEYVCHPVRDFDISLFLCILINYFGQKLFKYLTMADILSLLKCAADKDDNTILTHLLYYFGECFDTTDIAMQLDSLIEKRMLSKFTCFNNLILDSESAAEEILTGIYRAKSMSNYINSCDMFPRLKYDKDGFIFNAEMIDLFKVAIKLTSAELVEFILCNTSRSVQKSIWKSVDYIRPFQDYVSNPTFSENVSVILKSFLCYAKDECTMLICSDLFPKVIHSAVEKNDYTLITTILHDLPSHIVKDVLDREVTINFLNNAKTEASFRCLAHLVKNVNEQRLLHILNEIDCGMLLNVAYKACYFSTVKLLLDNVSGENRSKMLAASSASKIIKAAVTKWDYHIIKMFLFRCTKQELTNIFEDIEILPAIQAYLKPTIVQSDAHSKTLACLIRFGTEKQHNEFLNSNTFWAIFYRALKYDDYILVYSIILEFNSYLAEQLDPFLLIEQYSSSKHVSILYCLVGVPFTKMSNKEHIRKIVVETDCFAVLEKAMEEQHFLVICKLLYFADKDQRIDMLNSKCFLIYFRVFLQSNLTLKLLEVIISGIPLDEQFYLWKNISYDDLNPYTKRKIWHLISTRSFEKNAQLLSDEIVPMIFACILKDQHLVQEQLNGRISCEILDDVISLLKDALHFCIDKSISEFKPNVSDKFVPSQIMKFVKLVFFSHPLDFIKQPLLDFLKGVISVHDTMVSNELITFLVSEQNVEISKEFICDFKSHLQNNDHAGFKKLMLHMSPEERIVIWQHVDYLQLFLNYIENADYHTEEYETLLMLLIKYGSTQQHEMLFENGIFVMMLDVAIDIDHPIFLLNFLENYSNKTDWWINAFDLPSLISRFNSKKSESLFVYIRYRCRHATQNEKIEIFSKADCVSMFSFCEKLGNMEFIELLFTLTVGANRKALLESAPLMTTLKMSLETYDFSWIYLILINLSDKEKQNIWTKVDYCQPFRVYIESPIGEFSNKDFRTLHIIVKYGGYLQCEALVKEKLLVPLVQEAVDRDHASLVLILIGRFSTEVIKHLDLNSLIAKFQKTKSTSILYCLILYSFGSPVVADIIRKVVRGNNYVSVFRYGLEIGQEYIFMGLLFLVDETQQKTLLLTKEFQNHLQNKTIDYLYPFMMLIYPQNRYILWKPMLYNASVFNFLKSKILDTIIRKSQDMDYNYLAVKIVPVILGCCLGKVPCESMNCTKIKTVLNILCIELIKLMSCCIDTILLLPLDTESQIKVLKSIKNVFFNHELMYVKDELLSYLKENPKVLSD